MKRKQKIQPTSAITQYIVEGLEGLRDPVAAVLRFEKKDYKSGHTFTFKGKRVRVWNRSHYDRYFSEVGRD